eukprot:339329_1
MPMPNKRLVIDKDHGITTKPIPRRTEKRNIFMKKGKTKGVMRYLARQADIKRRKQTQRNRDKKMHQPFKHHKTRGSYFQFRRIETLVKNKHAEMKHWSMRIERKKNKNLQKQLRKHLKEVSVLLIIRIHRKKNLPPQIKKQMNNLRLLKPFNCVLVRNTKRLQLILNDILPFITFGIPTKETIRDLVLKRGRLIDEKTGNKSVIKSNMIIEKVLGKYDIICIEDIIHALSRNIKNNNKSIEIFDGVTNVMNPFELNRMHVPMRGLRTPFSKMGYWGYRGTYVNTFVEKII